MQFYKRRMIRLLLPYIIISVFFLIIDALFQKDFSIEQWLFEFSLVAFWIQHKGAWFVALIIPIYLVCPFFYKLLKLTSRKLSVCIILIVGIMMLTSHDSYPTESSQFSLTDNLQWAFGRSISFVLGFYFAHRTKIKRSINIFVVFGINVAIFVLLRIVAPCWFRNWCYVIPLIVTFCILLSLKSFIFANKIWGWLGTISLESYLTNIGYNHRMHDIIGNANSLYIFQGHYLEYLIVIILGLLTAFYVHKVVSRSSGLISKT